MEHLLRTYALMVILPSVLPCSNGALLLEAPSFFSHSGPHCFCQSLTIGVSRGICSCYEGFCSFGPNFNLFKDHCFFTSFSSSRFILAMFKFFDGILTKNKFGFFFKHVQDDIHPFDSPFNLWALKHGIQTTLGFI